MSQHSCDGFIFCSFVIANQAFHIKRMLQCPCHVMINWKSNARYYNGISIIILRVTRNSLSCKDQNLFRIKKCFPTQFKLFIQ